MSSSCLSGGGRAAYGAFDLDIMKPPPSASAASSSSTSLSSHHSPSPSSTLSESSNSPLAISTKKPRTQRKRPNQTYAEAAALLAKIYPNIFSAKNLRKHCRSKLARGGPRDYYSVDPDELLPPFPALADAGFLLHGPTRQEIPNSIFDPKPVNSRPKGCCSPSGSEFRDPCCSPAVEDDDFDAESILDEEVGEGIDSIMGNPVVDSCAGNGESVEDPPNYAALINPYLGIGGGYGFGFGGNITRALRHGGGGRGEWWCSPTTVEMQNIVQKPKPAAAALPEKKKKKKKKVEKLEKVEEKVDASGKAREVSAGAVAKFEPEGSSEQASPRPSAAGGLKPALGLKLNYDGVLKEWSGGVSPFSEVADSSDSPADIMAKLSDIDLFSETAGSGGVREASVLRYKEKRRSRLFSKKIRYQVLMVNTDLEPRMNSSGKFVKKDGKEELRGDGV